MAYHLTCWFHTLPSRDSVLGKTSVLGVLSVPEGCARDCGSLYVHNMGTTLLIEKRCHGGTCFVRSQLKA